MLEDSPLVVLTATGCEVLVDERLAAVAPAQRVAYHDRLAAGGGYDDQALVMVSWPPGPPAPPIPEPRRP